MSKLTKVSLVKKSAMKMKSAPHGKAGPAVEFVFADNEDSTCTVWGVDAGGNQLDIAAVAKLDPAPSSMNAAIVSVDPPAGMTFKMHAVGPLTIPGTPVNIDVEATWNDGSLGPFAFTLPCSVVAGPAGGIVVVPGPPTSR